MGVYTHLKLVVQTPRFDTAMRGANALAQTMQCAEVTSSPYVTALRSRLLWYLQAHDIHCFQTGNVPKPVSVPGTCRKTTICTSKLGIQGCCSSPETCAVPHSVGCPACRVRKVIKAGRPSPNDSSR